MNTLIIKWFFLFAATEHSDMLWMLHAPENYRKDNKWQNENLLYEYQMSLLGFITEALSFIWYAFHA